MMRTATYALRILFHKLPPLSTVFPAHVYRFCRLRPSPSLTIAGRMASWTRGRFGAAVALAVLPSSVLTITLLRRWNGARHLVPLLDLINCAEGPDPSRVHSTALDDSVRCTAPLALQHGTHWAQRIRHRAPTPSREQRGTSRRARSCSRITGSPTTYTLSTMASPLCQTLTTVPK